MVGIMGVETDVLTCQNCAKIFCFFLGEFLSIICLGTSKEDLEATHSFGFDCFSQTSYVFSIR
jgi:hypothetical protein